jgi:23S rRNA pseudouridine1911/1915/1917 synthase
VAAGDASRGPALSSHIRQSARLPGYSPEMSATIKLPAGAGGERWEVPVLYEDDHLLALDKPAGLAAWPDPLAPDLPNLISLLHTGVAEGKAWARERRLQYLMNAHRLDPEISGVFLLAKDKSVLATLANLFGSEKPHLQFLALVQGAPAGDRFVVEASLAPHPARPGVYHVDPRRGKRARTSFEVLEKFDGWTLLKCEPLTARPHQLRVHLRQVRLSVAGDNLYGGRPLWLSRLKPQYRLKPNREERPLIGRPALHAAELILPHPVTGQPLTLTAPWPKDLSVAVKYLRRYAPG